MKSASFCLTSLPTPRLRPPNTDSGQGSALNQDVRDDSWSSRKAEAKLPGHRVLVEIAKEMISSKLNLPKLFFSSLSIQFFCHISKKNTI